MRHHGTPSATGRPQICFGKLFDLTSNTFEALSGTLSTARKLKVIVRKLGVAAERCESVEVRVFMQKVNGNSCWGKVCS